VYPLGEGVMIEVQLSPATCQTATNGSVVRLASQRLLEELGGLIA
jgi:hypothetical protein